MQTLLRMGLSLYLSLEFVVNNSDFRLVLRHKKLEVFPKKKRVLQEINQRAQLLVFRPPF